MIADTSTPGGNSPVPLKLPGWFDPRFGWIPNNYQGRRKIAAIRRGKGVPNGRKLGQQRGGGEGPVGWSLWRRRNGRKLRRSVAESVTDVAAPVTEEAAA